MGLIAKKLLFFPTCMLKNWGLIQIFAGFHVGVPYKKFGAHTNFCFFTRTGTSLYWYFTVLVLYGTGIAENVPTIQTFK